MKYCMHCGEPLSDDALFCTKCGAKTRSSVTARTTDDGQGIVIDAPEGSTVTITNDDEHSKAPDQEGEFVIASWEEAKTSTEEKPQTVTERPQETNNSPKAPAKRSGLLGMIATVVKMAVIIAIVIVAIVFVKQMFKGKGSERQTIESPEHPFQEPESQVLGHDGPSVEEPVTPEAGDEGGVIVNDGSQFDDMPLHQKAEYLEDLLERTERALDEELDKGDDADPSKIKEYRDLIRKGRKMLKDMKQ